MPTGAVRGHGALLKIGDGATPAEAFVTIAEIQSITGPSGTLETVEIVTHDTAKVPSTGQVPVAEYLATVFREGSISFNGIFLADNTQHLALRNDQRNGIKRNFQLLFTDVVAQTAAFAAHITELSREHPATAEARFSATLQISGLITWS
jgi:predicted secreted protein